MTAFTSAILNHPENKSVLDSLRSGGSPPIGLDGSAVAHPDLLDLVREMPREHVGLSAVAVYGLPALVTNRAVIVVIASGAELFVRLPAESANDEIRRGEMPKGYRFGPLWILFWDTHERLRQLVSRHFGPDA